MPKPNNTLLREPLAKFSSAMEAKLKKNDHKAHWSGLSIGYLVECLENEIAELTSDLIDQDAGSARIECVDIANFAMMVFDNLGRIGRNQDDEAD